MLELFCLLGPSDSSSDLRESSVDSELEFILSKAKQLRDDVEDYRKELSPDRNSVVSWLLSSLLLE